MKSIAMNPKPVHWANPKPIDRTSSQTLDTTLFMFSHIKSDNNRNIFTRVIDKIISNSLK